MRDPAGQLEFLPSPSVRFAPDFLRRAGALVLRLSSIAERREGRGRSALFGSGEEFVGHRRYRPGEDLRQLDWNLLARLDQAFVRVSKREASEDWVVLLDTSASMGVGSPGKLQSAAELAAALAALGLRAGARVTLRSSADRDRLTVKHSHGIGAVLSWLETKRASGERGLAGLFEGVRHSRAGRLFALGDFFDLEPADVLRAQGRARELYLLRILAREELVPMPCDAVEWVDPESGNSRRMRVDSRVLAAYELELSRELERWRELAARHRLVHGCWSCDTPFEAIAREVLAT